MQKRFTWRNIIKLLFPKICFEYFALVSPPPFPYITFTDHPKWMGHHA